MKFTCTTLNLKKVVSLVERSTARKINLPILSSILFSADHGRVTLTTTNLEIATQAWMNAKISEEGTIAIPAHLISSYLQTIK